jgi:hypothetical protein
MDVNSGSSILIILYGYLFRRDFFFFVYSNENKKAHMNYCVVLYDERPTNLNPYHLGVSLDLLFHLLLHLLVEAALFSKVQAQLQDRK